MNIAVGITGGIGSGKSYVCGILEKMGYPVYYSDLASKKLTDQHPEIRKGLIELLGDEVYLNDSLNRPFLAAKIFKDDQLRSQVNELIHPIVRNDFVQWKNAQVSKIVFNEAAILIETGAYKTLDYLVLVTADEEVRIQRTMSRDSISRDEVLARMDKQMSDEEKIPYADFIVYNDDRPLLIQLEQMIESISNKCSI